MEGDLKEEKVEVEGPALDMTRGYTKAHFKINNNCFSNHDWCKATLVVVIIIFLSVNMKSNMTSWWVCSSQDKETPSQLQTSHSRAFRTIASHLPRISKCSFRLCACLTTPLGLSDLYGNSSVQSVVIETRKALHTVCRINPPQQGKLSDHTDPLWFLCGGDHINHTLENITHQATFMSHMCVCVWRDLEHLQQ